jgi:hypothetical protein
VNIGFGYSQPLSSTTAAIIFELVDKADLTWTSEDGFYSEMRAPMLRVFDALGCSAIFSLLARGSPHAPEPEDAREVIRAIADTLVDGGQKRAAVVFAVEFDEDPRFQSGSPADLDRLIQMGWADNRMRFSDRRGQHPYFIQEYNEVPLVFDLTPPSA